MRRSTEYKWHVSPNKSSPIGDILKEDLSKDEVIDLTEQRGQPQQDGDTHEQIHRSSFQQMERMQTLPQRQFIRHQTDGDGYYLHADKKSA